MRNIDIMISFQVSDNVTEEQVKHVAWAMKVQAEEPVDEDGEEALWLPEGLVTTTMAVNGIEVEA